MAQAVALWVTEQQYPRFREVCGESVEDSYDLWQQRAERHIANAEAQGIEVVKIFFDVEQFVRWCAFRKIDPDKTARHQFAVAIAHNQDRQGGATPNTRQ